MLYLQQLNTAQQQAVCSDSFHCLILAGAGSGKTRVLVQRVVWLIEQSLASPWQIFAVTFTNKAALEMKDRINHQTNVSEMWVGTFHSLAHRILRKHAQQAFLPSNFQILDSAESKALAKRLIKENHLDHTLEVNELTAFISRNKEQGLRSYDINLQKHPYWSAKTRLYEQYEQACESMGVIDFSEILLRVYELFKNNDEVLAHYQQRFKHILVDEFQDTNTIQYLWLKQLAGSNNQLFMVGDDDQSIYAWRGAKVENIHTFIQDFDQVETIRLEQNYRSSACILKAANAVIAHNQNRLGKELWTEEGFDEQNNQQKIDHFEAYNDLEESRFVIESIQSAIKSGVEASQIAILYRTNAQSRVLEEELLKAKIPYTIYGGLRFYERAEIKDALSYVRLLYNSSDDIAFQRAINTPVRGVGQKTIQSLAQVAQKHECSLFDAIEVSCDEMLLANRSLKPLSQFKRWIDGFKLENLAEDVDLKQIVKSLIEQSDLISHYDREGPVKKEVREQNLEELIRAAEQFQRDSKEELTEVLGSFCAHAALESGEQMQQNQGPAIQMMTLHSAKGLEFEQVFLVGLEEGLFPASGKDEKALEEERRLMYVGITRAKKKLTLTYAQSRLIYGKVNQQMPSRFLKEIPPVCLYMIRVRRRSPSPFGRQGFQNRWHQANYSNQTTAQLPENSKWYAGQNVKHQKFGQGVVIQVQGDKVIVNFEEYGTKTLLSHLAKMEVF